MGPLMDGLLSIRIGSVGNWLFLARRRQSEEPIRLHPQQRNPAAHVLEVAVGAQPAEALTARA
jgi:hypothetical protein